MNHFAKIAEKLNTYGLDGMLLTCEANRFYAPASTPPAPTAWPW